MSSGQMRLPRHHRKHLRASRSPLLTRFFTKSPPACPANRALPPAPRCNEDPKVLHAFSDAAARACSAPPWGARAQRRHAPGGAPACRARRVLGCRGRGWAKRRLPGQPRQRRAPGGPRGAGLSRHPAADERGAGGSYEHAGVVSARPQGFQREPGGRRRRGPDAGGRAQAHARGSSTDTAGRGGAGGGAAKRGRAVGEGASHPRADRGPLPPRAHSFSLGAVSHRWANQLLRSWCTARP